MDPVTIGLIAAGTAGTVYAPHEDASFSSDATDAAMKQKADSQAFIQKQIDQARSDIFKLFPSAQDSRQKGLQAGLDLYKQALPQMLNTYQQGNVGAQKILSAGLPQMNNALLGNKVDYSAFQPTTLQQPTAPTMPNAQAQPISGLGLNTSQQPQMDPNIVQLLQQAAQGMGANG